VHCKEFLKDNSNDMLRIDEMSRNRIPRVEVEGVMGSGKDNAHREKVVSILATKDYKTVIVSNYVASSEDAEERVEQKSSSVVNLFQG
jgi:Ni2+-binding GTPase involved in maturation of urease and hydrogenase